MMRWKVGALAAACGVTVRTLHYFDEIGLVHPSARTASGHRLYTDEDVRRLYRVLALRQLGMPLGDVAGALSGDGYALADAVRAQLADVERQLDAYRTLHRRLLALREAVDRTPAPSVDELLTVMEAMMKASYFTPDQLARLKQRHREAGDAGFAAWQRRWAEIAAEVAAHIEDGTDPADPRAQLTASRWAELMDHMSGGDRGILSAMYASIDGKGAEAATKGAISTPVWEYVKRAFAVGYGAR